jgi:hypothetical protein
MKTKEIIGLALFFITLVLASYTPDPHIILGLGPLAIAGIGAGLKVGGAIFGGLRRRSRRKALERQLGRLQEETLGEIDKTRRAAVQGGLAQRELALEGQERELESLQQQALRASGGAQEGLDPASLEALSRARAASGLQLEAGIADRITQAAQEAARERARIIREIGLQRAGIRQASGEATDRAIGGVLESVGGGLSMLGGGGTAGSPTGGGGVPSFDVGQAIANRRFVGRTTL